jgi:hypothetical protein
MDSKKEMRFGVAPWAPDEADKVKPLGNTPNSPELNDLLLSLATRILEKQGRNPTLDLGASVQITILMSPDPWK